MSNPRWKPRDLSLGRVHKERKLEKEKSPEKEIEPSSGRF